MYDRVVKVPRLLAGFPKDGPGHPLLFELGRRLAVRYGVAFPRVTMAYYRSGDDSVAWHGDTIARELPTALVGTLSLGGPRKFLLRPRAGGRTREFWLGQGDLLVMGGTCQRTWEHSIPKTTSPAPPRLAVMYRPIWTLPDGPRPR
jgi:alkylated DNA repair dioxygenase AlkB